MNLTEQQKNCPYCQHGKPLIGDGSPNDDNYNCVWIDKDGKLQQKTDAMGFACIDTVVCVDGKQLKRCPFCNRPFSKEE